MLLQIHFFNILLALSQLTHCRPTLSNDTSADIRQLHGLTKVTRDSSGRRGDPVDKYFHESTFHPHYDGRFAETVLSYDERRTALSLLLRTYLSTMHDIRAETWIMHGSLLGWWWNRRVMPWDSDIDVQVSETSIHYLASYYNMTVHHFDMPGPIGSEQAGRNYLLEVNPHYKDGSVSDILNVIDARWVDMSTGLFIDITALRYNHVAEKEGRKGWMMCKDRHNYLAKDIFPLRDSVFEDMPVKIPYSYAELLEEEYGKKALTATEWEGHVFSQDTKEWKPRKGGISLSALKAGYKPLTTGPEGRRPSRRPSSEGSRTNTEA